MRAAVLFLVALGACTPREWNAADHASFGAAIALTGCDFAGTQRAADSMWRDSGENNPILGSSPSPSAVVGYFATALSLEVVAWAVLPPRYRTAAYASIAAIELETVVGNVHGAGVCGQGPAWVDRP